MAEVPRVKWRPNTKQMNFAFFFNYHCQLTVKRRHSGNVLRMKIKGHKFNIDSNISAKTLKILYADLPKS